MADSGVTADAGVDICADLKKNNDAILAAAKGACPDHASSEAATRTAVAEQSTKTSFFRYCVESNAGKGTWAVKLTSAKIADPVGEVGGYEVQYEVVHRPAAITAATASTAARGLLHSTAQRWRAYPDETTVITKETMLATPAGARLSLAETTWQNGSGEEASTLTFTSDGKALSSAVAGKTVISRFGSPRGCETLIFARAAASLAAMNSTPGFFFAAAIVAVSVSACTKDKTSDSTAPATSASAAAGDSVLTDIKYGGVLPARGTTAVTQQGVRGGTGSTVVSAGSKLAAEEDTNRAMRKHAHVDKADCTTLPDNAAECDGNKFYFCDDQQLWVTDCDAEAKFGGSTEGSCFEGDKFIDCLGCGKAADGTDECCDFSRTVCCDKAGGGCFSPTKG